MRTLLNPKLFPFGIFIGLGLLIGIISYLPDGKLHLVFCDVGQGDAAYIRTPDNEDILIDGGPDEKVLSCLGRHMPFYDRQLDLVILSHPQADHLTGALSVLERYSVKYYISGPEGNTTVGYQKLKKLISDKKIIFKNLYTGEQIKLSSVNITGLWPSRKWVEGKINDTIGPQVLGASTSYKEINDFSEVLRLNYGRFSALFPGDADSHIQPEILEANPDLAPINILKVPHHGSKTGLLDSFLEKINPSLAVISVGRNSYGHPNLFTLGQLRLIGSQIIRTDEAGDIEIISDGKSWWKRE